MSLQEALAALLLRGPAHGYELQSTLESELYPLWMTRASQVYLTLNRMARDGLVTAQRIRQESRPDRQIIRLTPRGRQAAYRWIFEPGKSDEMVVRYAIARLVVPDRFGEIIKGSLEDRTSALRQLRRMVAEYQEGFQRESLEAEVLRVQSQLRWLTAIDQSVGEIVARPSATKRKGRSVTERYA